MNDPLQDFFKSISDYYKDMADQSRKEANRYLTMIVGLAILILVLIGMMMC